MKTNTVLKSQIKITLMKHDHGVSAQTYTQRHTLSLVVQFLAEKADVSCSILYLSYHHSEITAFFWPWAASDVQNDVLE